VPPSRNPSVSRTPSAGPLGDYLALTTGIACSVNLPTSGELGRPLGRRRVRLPALALPDWRRNGPPGARLAGAGARTMTLGLAILAGAALALLTYSAAGPWF
jgi:hypothetical protein